METDLLLKTEKRIVSSFLLYLATMAAKFTEPRKVGAGSAPSSQKNSRMGALPMCWRCSSADISGAT